MNAANFHDSRPIHVSLLIFSCFFFLRWLFRRTWVCSSGEWITARLEAVGALKSPSDLRAFSFIFIKRASETKRLMQISGRTFRFSTIPVRRYE